MLLSSHCTIVACAQVLSRFYIVSCVVVLIDQTVLNTGTPYKASHVKGVSGLICRIKHTLGRFKETLIQGCRHFKG